MRVTQKDYDDANWDGCRIMPTNPRQTSRDSMLNQLNNAKTIGELKLVMMRIIMVMK